MPRPMSNVGIVEVKVEGGTCDRSKALGVSSDSLYIRLRRDWDDNDGDERAAYPGFLNRSRNWSVFPLTAGLKTILE